MSQGKKSTKNSLVPTVQDIVNDPITTFASEFWANGAENSKFDIDVLKKVFEEGIKNGHTSKLQILELSGYLENFLWKFYGNTSSVEHTFSIIVMINEKFGEKAIFVFESLTKENGDKFKLFFENVILLSFKEMDIKMKYVYISFLINLFLSLEDIVVRQCVLQYVSLSLWKSLSRSRLIIELENFPHIKRHWDFLNKQEIPKKEEKTDFKSNDENPSKKQRLQFSTSLDEDYEASWIPHLLKSFMDSIETSNTEEIEPPKLHYIERFIEFLIDLLSQLPTRRFLNTLVCDMHVIVRCRRSFLYKTIVTDHEKENNNKIKVIEKKKFQLFVQLIDMLDEVCHHEVDDQTGTALTYEEALTRNISQIHKLQSIAFKKNQIFEPLKDLIFSSTKEIGKIQVLKKYFLLLDHSQLLELANQLGYITAEADQQYTHLNAKIIDVDFLMDILLSRLTLRKSRLDELNSLSLYPNEQLLWDANQVPLSHSFVFPQDSVPLGHTLALPKLNLQFLTFHDYLYRNFTLYRLESAFEVRQDIVDAISRISPRRGLRGETTFAGWARMAVPVTSVAIEEVSKPRLGEDIPEFVYCTVEVNLACYDVDIRSEWDSLRKHDVVFLVLFQSSALRLSENVSTDNSKNIYFEEDLDFPFRYGVRQVRGAEVCEVKDQQDNVIHRSGSEFVKPTGSKRKYKLRLDSSQYFDDLKAGVEFYDAMQIMIRRKPQENNFKSVLETIRDLFNCASLNYVPSWIKSLMLGIGNPTAATFRTLKYTDQAANCIDETDFFDTFIDADHVSKSFPTAALDLTACTLPQKSGAFFCKARCSSNDAQTSSSFTKEKVTIIPYEQMFVGPLLEDDRSSNVIPFTPTQIEAIHSGINPGLTLIVGPPGTGKTDVAVQIITTLYHNHPNQKILLLTHSNSALNDLFAKIIKRNVDPRHLLRLGSGERDLRPDLPEGAEFSKQGRVTWCLERRSVLLSQVQVLSQSLVNEGVQGDHGYTCETASYFFHQQIKPRIEIFYKNASIMNNLSIESLFPFKMFFSSSSETHFTGSISEDYINAEKCLLRLLSIFKELEDYRAFELLRTQDHRTDFLLVKQARIIALTCTHASMKRRSLLELGFKYDSIIIEEAAQVLEVETFVPMLLQHTNSMEENKIKRLVLIGDHFQLPPVVKHSAFQKYSKLDQSMFSRFVRLGVPHILLDTQGRARPEIASLYSWRYLNKDSLALKNLDCVKCLETYTTSNAGFLHTFQMINVEAFQGKGETCPTPHFYQNLGEAEFVVAVYQYMRLLGYPSEKISIITTYNGQKHLIRDVINKRCNNVLFGLPAHITTVDKFQGQQNDYVLLSLVRTESVGHLRDVRRLVVAMSRARLGLYIFCRHRLFENCCELTPAFNILSVLPTELQLVAGEEFPSNRPSKDKGQHGLVIHNVSDVTAMGVLVYQLVQQAQSIVTSK